MKPYPKYKDSGIVWLGKIPEHWESAKIRSILSPIIEKNRSDLPLLSVVREKGVIKRNIESKEENHNYIPDDLSNYKVVKKGQFAMNKMKAWQGSYGVSAFDGIVSPAYFTFQIDRVEREFFHAAMRSKAYVPFFTQASDGVRVGQWDLNQSRMGDIPFFIPPESEQTQIARYLDWQTSKINKFIKNKKKLIALLKEQKQNIINEAVTKGLNPNVKMKNSGVEWIGEIPMHWEALYIRRCTKFVKTGGTPKGANESHFCEKGFNWFTPSDFKEEVFLKNSYRQLSELGKKDVKLFPANTVMMIGIGGTIGKVSISPDISSCNQQINAIFTNERVVSIYMTFALRCLKSFIIECGKYTTMPIINQDETKTLKIPVPPISEQQEIVAFIEKETALIDKTIARTEKEIELIQEYRTRLVSDVVTGKIDVRDVEVPDFVEEIVEINADEDENEEEFIQAGDEGND